MGIAYRSKCLDYTVYGKSEQEVTQIGKNLCPSQAKYWEIGYYSETTGQKALRSYNARAIDLIEITPSTQLYFNTFSDTYRFVVRTYDKNKQFIRSLGARNNGTTSTINGDEYYISASIQNPSIETGNEGQVIINKISSEEIKPFICLNSESDKSFVPFTPNSPSPDYPSEIKTIPSVVNLFDGQFRQGGWNETTSSSRIYSTQNYPVKKGVTYTFSTDLDTSSISDFYISIALSTQPFLTPDNQIFYDTVWVKTNVHTFTPTQDGYLGVGIRYGSNKDLTPNTVSQYEFMLEQGSTVHPYVPFGYYLRIDDVGKNFWNYSKRAWQAASGIGLKGYTDNSFNLRGTGPWSNYGVMFNNYKKNTDMVISADFIDETMSYKVAITAYGNNALSTSGLTSLKMATMDVKNIKQKLSVAFNSGDYDYIFVRFWTNYTNNTLEQENNLMIRNIQWELGTEATKFEPYREPKTYFIDLAKKNLLENNVEIINSSSAQCEKIDNGYRVTILSAGTNRNIRLKLNNSDLLLGKTLTLSCQSKASGTNNGIVRIYWLNENGGPLTEIKKLSETGGTFTISPSYPDGAKSVGILLYGNFDSNTSQVGDYVDYTNIKLYEGTSSEDHYELCSIGDVRDELVIENGYARVEKKIGKTILNGSEAWTSWFNYSGSNNCIGFYSYKEDMITGAIEDDYNDLLKCNMFSEAKTQLSIRDGEIEAIKECGKTGRVYIATGILKSRLDEYSTSALAISSFKNWLSKNLPIVYYILNEPYTADLGQVDFPVIDGEIKGIAYNGKEIKGVAYNGKIVFEAQD